MTNDSGASEVGFLFVCAGHYWDQLFPLGVWKARPGWCSGAGKRAVGSGTLGAESMREVCWNLGDWRLV